VEGGWGEHHWIWTGAWRRGRRKLGTGDLGIMPHGIDKSKKMMSCGGGTRAVEKICGGTRRTPAPATVLDPFFFP
jgi:hypothetical protein